MLQYFGTARAAYAAIAQLDRVTDYESVGRGFESLSAYQKSRYPIPDICFSFIPWDSKNQFATVRWTVAAAGEPYNLRSKLQRVPSAYRTKDKSRHQAVSALTIYTSISESRTSLPPSSRLRRPAITSFINSTVSENGNGSLPVRSQWTNTSNCFLNA